MLHRVVVLVVGLMVLAFVAGIAPAQEPDPQPGADAEGDGDDAPAAEFPDLTPAELWLNASIVRDRWGVPTCIGDTDEACVFAFGIAQAQDHWREMLINYHMAAGTMAEWFGTARSPLAVSVERESNRLMAAMMTNPLVDRLVRTFRIPDLGAERYAKLPVKMRRLLTAFAIGVNFHLDGLGDEQRPEFARDVSGVDIMRLATFISFSRTMEFLTDEPLKMPQSGRGSNQFVIAPTLSSTGHVMMHMDPHLDYTGLSQWYEAGLRCPSFHMRGATFFGMPMLVMGFTEHLTWSMTRNRPDVVDIYREKVNPANPAQYWNPDLNDGAGGWANFEVRHVDIRVRQDDGSVKVEREMLARTRHGPVLPRTISMTAGAGGIYTARSSLLEAEKAETGGFIGQLVKMASATTMVEFRAAVSMQQIPLWNIMAGSKQGDIWYVYNAWVPKRPTREVDGETVDAFDWKRPLPGHTNEAEWLDFFTFDELPQILNPASGWMQNCNCHPNHVTDGDDDFDVPEYLCPPRVTQRSDRARELLGGHAARGRVFPDEFRAIGQDCFVPPAKELIPRIARGAGFVDGPMQDVLMNLLGWDCQARADSVPACHFLTWYRLAERKLHRLTTDQQIAADFLAHMRTFADELGDGRLEVAWGELHGIQRGDHWIPVSGANMMWDTLRCARWPGPRRSCLFGSSFLQTVVFGSDGKPRADSCLPFGTSEDPSSPHFVDQALQLYSKDRLKPAWFDHDDVGLHAASFETGRFLRLRAHPDQPPLRVFAPYNEDETIPMVCRGRVRRVDDVPRHWECAGPYRTYEVIIEDDGAVMVPEAQPSQFGRPLYAVEDYFGPDWKSANGHRMNFNPGLPRRGLYGLYRKRHLDPFEDF